MFQNLQRDIKQNSWEEQQESHYEKAQNQNKRPVKEILKSLFRMQNVALYIIAFLVSMVGFRSENIVLNMAPFAISFLAAMLSNRMSIGISYLLTLVGTFISFGANSVLVYFLTSLVFFVFILVKRPKYQEGVNEQSKVGVHLVISVLAVQIVPMFFRTFYIYDFLTSMMLAICSYVFYKIFANSILMIKEFGIKKAFSIEEVMGTSLLLSISLCALGDLKIFGYSLCNILSILIVLILGWKNGMLVRSNRRNYHWNCARHYR